MVVIHLGIIMVRTIIDLGPGADSIIEAPVVAINQFPVMRVLSTVLREGLQLPLVPSIEEVLVYKNLDDSRLWGNKGHSPPVKRKA